MHPTPGNAVDDYAEIESLMCGAMDGVVGDYATRVAFALDRLAITEGRDRMIPVAELAERLSKILGRPIDREEFLMLAQDIPGDRVTLEAMARILEVQMGWLSGRAPLSKGPNG